MASTASLEGVKKAVFFPFQGKKWGLKWLIGAAVNLIPIVGGIAMSGYAGEIAKHVINEDKDPEMPEWNDLGTFITDGIKWFGVRLLYSLPATLTMLTGYMLMFGMYFIFLMGAVASAASDSSDQILGYFGISMVSFFAGMLLILVGLALAVIASFLTMPALGHAIATNQFSAAFRIKEWWPILKVNFSGFLLAIIILYGFTFLTVGILSGLYYTIILTPILPFLLYFVMFILVVIQYSLIAVAYRDGVRKLAGVE